MSQTDRRNGREGDTERDPAGIEHVADPESYNQTRRLKEIHDARREFYQRKRQAEEAKIKGEIKLHQYTDLVLKAFQNYFHEVEGLMHRHSNGDYYLHEVDLGGIDPLDRDGTIEFTGLMDLTGGQPTVAVRGYTIDSRNKQTNDSRVLLTVPESIVMTAFRLCNRFVAEAGLDAEMEDDVGDAGFDYSDILEEGPPSGTVPDIEQATTD